MHNSLLTNPVNIQYIQKFLKIKMKICAICILTSTRKDDIIGHAAISPSGVIFPLYHAPGNLSSTLCDKNCTKFFPKFRHFAQRLRNRLLNLRTWQWRPRKLYPLVHQVVKNFFKEILHKIQNPKSKNFIQNDEKIFCFVAFSQNFSLHFV